MRQYDEGRVQQAVAELDRVRNRWLRMDGVEAVDVGYAIRSRDGRLDDELAVRVHVAHKLPPEAVPNWQRFDQWDGDGRLGDFPIDVVEAAYGPSHDDRRPVEPRPADVDPRERLTPLMGGVSIGNPRVTAGTLGAIVWDRSDGSPNILSNWHVLAGTVGGDGDGSGPQPHYQTLAGAEPHYQTLAGAEPHYQLLAALEPHYQLLFGVEPHYQSASSGQPHRQVASVGEPIYQPGRFDGGTSSDAVAHLSRLRLDRHMDAAIARLNGARAYVPEIIGIGAVREAAEPRLGMRVRKCGRSTRLTKGIVDGVSLSTTITYAHGKHRFDDQIHIVPGESWPRPGPDVEVSEGGDSGAVWVDKGSGKAVGLHFAGELDPAPRSEHALASPMPRVAEALDISFSPLIAPAPLRSGRPADPRVLARLLLASSARAGADSRAALLEAFAALLAADTRGRSGGGDELRALRAVLDAALDGDG